MIRFACSLVLAYAGGNILSASTGDGEVVFRSDVSLVRVDAQVVDGAKHTIPNLRIDDFVLQENGHIQPIRQFGSEDMPVDILFLLDVSASMGPHVERIAQASRQALSVLGKDDRMGIMVFDRAARLRLPFSESPQALHNELNRLLWQERFNGGTDITRAMLAAAEYMNREARRDARRAIVILTDDQTEYDRDEAAVSIALSRADTVMCALIAPDAMQFGRYPSRVGPWRRGGVANRSHGQAGFFVSIHTQSAGTVEIARRSGGDDMPVDHALSLQETLVRLRQRYTLFFNLSDGVKPGQERAIEVRLAASTASLFPDAEVHYRRVYMTPNAHDESPDLAAKP
jgi:VWFA-related protein